MNFRKRSQGGDGAKRKRVVRKMKVKMLHDLLKSIEIGYETSSAAVVSWTIIETSSFLEQSQ